MLKQIAIAITVVFTIGAANAQKTNCRQIEAKADKEQAFLNPPMGADVIGEGRLYFYVAPHDDCRSKEVFVVPADQLFAYTEYKEWISVMYINPKTEKDFSGWVKADRLKMTGSLRPKQ